MEKVIVYSKLNCMQCEFTKQFLQTNEIDFIVKDVTENDADLQAVKAMGFMSLPVVVIPGEAPFSGFRPDQLEKLL